MVLHSVFVAKKKRNSISIFIIFMKTLDKQIYNMCNRHINKFKEVIIMIGDVGKAEKKFRNLVGKSKADELLKRLDAAEAQNLKGENMMTYLEEKIGGVKFELNDTNLGELFGERGIVYLLSTRPHTNSNSNFVKLVKNKVIPLRGYLMSYLEKPTYRAPDSFNNPISALIRYLKLKGTEETDKELEKIKEEDDEFEVKNKLRRKNNKDLAEKMQSRRLVNRLKVMVVALIIYLVDEADKKVKDEADKKVKDECRGKDDQKSPIIESGNSYD